MVDLTYKFAKLCSIDALIDNQYRAIQLSSAELVLNDEKIFEIPDRVPRMFL